MRLRDEPLGDDNLAEVTGFVRRSNPFSQHVWGWDTGRFMDWRWGINATFEWAQPGWFSRHCRVFRDGAGITAVSVAEYGAEHVCIITGREDPDSVKHVLGWLVAQHSDRGIGLRFDFSDSEEWLRVLFGSAGFVETPKTGIEWEYDLSNLPEIPAIPSGFTIASLADGREPDHAGIAECIEKSFGIESDMQPGLQSLELNPMFRPELSVFARTPDGRIAAYCRGTVDPDNGVSGIDPVCCHPDFQRMGLSKAVVQTCFRTQRDLGGRFSYIGSGPEPGAGTFLYRSLGPKSKTTSCAWSLA